MPPEDFARWLASLLEHGSSRHGPATRTSIDLELINGQTRPCVTVWYPSGDAFVLSIGKVSA
jgi:hypothetical protein